MTPQARLRYIFQMRVFSGVPGLVALYEYNQVFQKKAKIWRFQTTERAKNLSEMWRLHTDYQPFYATLLLRAEFEKVSYRRSLTQPFSAASSPNTMRLCVEASTHQTTRGVREMVVAILNRPFVQFFVAHFGAKNDCGQRRLSS